MKSQFNSIGKKSLIVLMAGSLLSTDVLTSCKSIKNNTNKTQRGAGIGAGSGAVIGGVVGRRSGNTALGAILGATVGGAAGAVIGRRMDKQAEEMKRQMPNAQVERVGEGIKITFGSDILFDVNSYQLKSETKRQLTEFAQTLNKYEDTDIRIEGHADATGTDSHNQQLSNQRAKAVGSFLESQGVKQSRVDEKGYGESQPVADNNSETGRSKNRRVDIAVFANKQMQRDAKAGKLDQ
ncbi:OmpA family protein [Spirosoma utsteinense]|uniref:Outer membrane protein OmpA-like peptidoglycan-associated protein n=1 Tax=Spirosoma utsteinense TaxID=2585773 RepID=A0ABR6W4C0_9BACT|nr:OmpA family protein [Spirosoma utsteinense]MBC3786402.1 outer membrane protein OmpA-like peptidoglycan-associated protein [Spirosoma utsteinense]MBC3791451.1 outer membrane protein OmpA-like peptidoglycan-associated protein [Spirosoma utsteinense]